MSVFARSDLLHVAVPRTGGGCGQGHTRPVVQGAPVKIWEFNECPQCEDYLRHDNQWGATISEIPETPDEIRIREDQEKRGQREAATSNAQALQQIANLPEGMATAFASAFAEALKGMNAVQALPPVTEATKRCPNDHPVPRDAKFCPECGTRSWKAPAKVVESEVVQPEDARPQSPGAYTFSMGDAPTPLTVPTNWPLNIPGEMTLNVHGSLLAEENLAATVAQAVDPARAKRKRAPKGYTRAELETKNLPELKEIARQVGARTKRSRGDQIVEIHKAIGR